MPSEKSNSSACAANPESLLKDLPLDQSLQRMCLILSGAIALYEEDAPEICRLLLAQQKEKLYLSLDLLGEALYWLREQVKTDLIAFEA